MSVILARAFPWRILPSANALNEPNPVQSRVGLMLHLTPLCLQNCRPAVSVNVAFSVGIPFIHLAGLHYPVELSVVLHLPGVPSNLIGSNPSPRRGRGGGGAGCGIVWAIR